jgi:hypothetical protein
MKELKKILSTYSSDLLMLGGGDESEETQNEKIEAMRVSLENLIKKETKKIRILAWFYVILIILAIVLFLIKNNGIIDNEVSRLASFFSITGATPVVLYNSMKQFKQKINATIVLEMAKKLNKETFNSALSVIMSIK